MAEPKVLLLINQPYYLPSTHLIYLNLNVHIPELDGDVFVRRLTVAERDAYFERMKPSQTKRVMPKRLFMLRSMSKATHYLQMMT